MIDLNLKESPKELIQVGQLIVEGKFEEAHQQMDKFKETGEFTTKDALLCNLLKSDILFQQGLYEDVIKLANETSDKCIELRENALAFDFLNLETQALLMLDKMDDVSKKIKEGEELLKIILQELPREYKKRKAALEYLKTFFHYLRGEPDEMKKHLDSCVVLLEEIGENRVYAYILISSIVYYAILKGDLEKALDNIEKGLVISRKNNYKYGMAAGLLGKGTLCILKGDADHSIFYHNQSLTLFKELNNNFYIASIHNNLAGIYRNIGNLGKALECIESSMIYHREKGNIRQLANNYDNLIQILINKGDLEQAQKAIEKFEHLKDQLKDNQINLVYLFNKALLLKTSPRSRNRIEAEDILKQIINDDTISYEIAINALFNICELLLIELRMTNDLSVLEEIDTYTGKLLEIAEKNHSFILFAEVYFLKAKLALLTFDLKTARRFLTQAQRIAERFGLNQLAAKISVEHDKLRNQLSIWDNLREKEISLSERIKLAGMDEQMKHLLQNFAILTTQVEEEQILVHKERKICIVCKGDILGYMYACNCEALYCDKCARALTEIENVCWVCNTPIDINKPIKPYKEEEFGKNAIIKENHKNPKNDDFL